jgi:hypothetical protein
LRAIGLEQLANESLELARRHREDLIPLEQFLDALLDRKLVPRDDIQQLVELLAVDAHLREPFAQQRQLLVLVRDDIEHHPQIFGANFLAIRNRLQERGHRGCRIVHFDTTHRLRPDHFFAFGHGLVSHATNANVRDFRTRENLFRAAAGLDLLRTHRQQSHQLEELAARDAGDENHAADVAFLELSGEAAHVSRRIDERLSVDEQVAFRCGERCAGLLLEQRVASLFEMRNGFDDTRVVGCVELQRFRRQLQRSCEIGRLLHGCVGIVYPITTPRHSPNPILGKP